MSIVKGNIEIGQIKEKMNIHSVSVMCWLGTPVLPAVFLCVSVHLIRKI